VEKCVIMVEPDDSKRRCGGTLQSLYYSGDSVVDPQDRMIGVIRIKDLFIGQRGPVSDR